MALQPVNPVAATAELPDAPEPEIALASRAGRLWPGFAAELEQVSAIPVGSRRNGALLVDPRDHAQWSVALARVLQDAAFAQELARRGRRRIE